MKNFGQLIREKRVTLGLKVYELAEKKGVEVNPVYITQIEKNNKLPSILRAKAICDAINDEDGSIFERYIADRQQHIANKEKKSQEFFVTTLSNISLSPKNTIKVNIPKNKKAPKKKK